MPPYLLAFDIGGTTLLAGRVGPDRQLLEPALERPVEARGATARVVDDLRALAQRCIERDRDAEPQGVAVALPDPSDYLTGTPWLEHKLQALHGRSLMTLLGREDRPIAFVNDAVAFALGETSAGAARGAKRVLALTLGTGLGSAFVVDGRPCEHGAGIPPGGQLWNQPFAGAGHTIEQEVGRAALERRWAAAGGDPTRSLADVAARARQGDEDARALFRQLGQALAVGLAETVRRFAPERLIVGGAIARSHGLFLPAFEARLADLVDDVPTVGPGLLGSSAALLGACDALDRRRERFSRRRIIYLHGFASSPQSNKAVRFVQALERRRVEVEVPRLDQGDFSNLTISRQLALLEQLTAQDPPGSVLLIGSSMGAYVAALFAARSSRVAGLVLMAPAFDFARRWTARLGAAAVARWRAEGSMMTPHYGSGRDEPIGWSLIADAQTHPAFPELRLPVLVFHGLADEVVDPELSRQFAAERPNVELELLEADHGLFDAIDHIIARSLAFLAPMWK